MKKLGNEFLNYKSVIRKKNFKATSGGAVIGQGMSFSNKLNIIKNHGITNIVILDPKSELDLGNNKNLERW